MLKSSSAGITSLWKVNYLFVCLFIFSCMWCNFEYFEKKDLANCNFTIFFAFYKFRLFIFMYWFLWQCLRLCFPVSLVLYVTMVEFMFSS